jgi:CheY-like chemotaxis protein
LVEARNAVGTKLRIGYRSAFLANPCRPKREVGFPIDDRIVGLFSSCGSDPNSRRRVNARGQGHDHGLAAHMTEEFIVMIADDDHSMLRVARRLIKSYGFPVRLSSPQKTFSPRDDSMQRLPGFGCQMPGLNGLELQSRLVSEGHQIPIIFITAFNDEDARARALEAGALAYLVKPFQEAELLRLHQYRDTTSGGRPTPTDRLTSVLTHSHGS